ncbi:MAG: hypothetical protein BHW29_09215 [Faecalibacterium sp. CAG:74_58_120]|nr:MAG: hypothetical protein BHW29_09215 [Faecalibacterium sp. CAG:74_58_120]
MAVIGQYGGWTFEIRANYMRPFKDFQIVSECETEDKTADAQKYVSAKNGKPIQITTTVTLNAYLGVNVRGDAIGLIDAAQRSYQGYFYIQSKKLFPFMLMLTRASIKNFVLSPNGQWIACDIDLTLKQSSKDWINGAPASSGGSGSGGGSSGGGSSSSGSKKASVKQKSTIASSIAKGVASVVSKVNSALKTTSTAKRVSSVIKKTTVVKKASPAKKIIRRKK